MFEQPKQEGEFHLKRHWFVFIDKWSSHFKSYSVPKHFGTFKLKRFFTSRMSRWTFSHRRLFDMNWARKSIRPVHLRFSGTGNASWSHRSWNCYLVQQPLCRWWLCGVRWLSSAVHRCFRFSPTFLTLQNTAMTLSPLRFSPWQRSATCAIVLTRPYFESSFCESILLKLCHLHCRFIMWNALKFVNVILLAISTIWLHEWRTSTAWSFPVCYCVD